MQSNKQRNKSDESSKKLRKSVTFCLFRAFESCTLEAANFAHLKNSNSKSNFSLNSTKLRFEPSARKFETRAKKHFLIGATKAATQAEKSSISVVVVLRIQIQLNSNRTKKKNFSNKTQFCYSKFHSKFDFRRSLFELRTSHFKEATEEEEVDKQMQFRQLFFSFRNFSSFGKIQI